MDLNKEIYEDSPERKLKDRISIALKDYYKETGIIPYVECEILERDGDDFDLIVDIIDDKVWEFKLGDEEDEYDD